MALSERILTACKGQCVVRVASPRSPFQLPKDRLNEVEILDALVACLFPPVARYEA